jgi:BASS family bile acid:Na+ symporter
VTKEPTMITKFIAERLEVVLVLAAAVIGLVFSGPVRTLVDHGAINVVLFVLVLAAALTLPAGAFAGLRAVAAKIVAVEAITLVALPLIAWAAAHLVDDGPVRLGIIAVGVAPAEIATVALTTVAAGETAMAACLLVVSTGITAILAAPILSLLAGSGGVRSGELVVTLILVVIIPLGIGVAVRPRLPTSVADPAGRVATGAVVVLVALVASQVTIDAGLARAVVALIVVIAAGAALGSALGRRLPARYRSAVLLSVSMRDFAVAAGIAAAAFGPEAAAPMGVYGILVMVWGSLVATRDRVPTP